MLMCAHFKLMSLPLLGSDFCIQIMESYLDRVLGMIKGHIHMVCLSKQSRSRCQGLRLCALCTWAEAAHEHLIRAAEKPKHLLWLCTSNSRKETFKLVFGCFMLHIRILYNLKRQLLTWTKADADSSLESLQCRHRAPLRCRTGKGLQQHSVHYCLHKKAQALGSLPPFLLLSLFFWDGGFLLFLCCPRQC